MTDPSSCLLVVGDSHGNILFLHRAAMIAQRLGITRMVQLGDFGMWPGDEGRRFILDLAIITEECGVRLDFIDGNHDDHAALDELSKIDECYDDDGGVIITENVVWWPRGSVVEIAGRRLGMLGGAVSMDRNHRVEGVSWWPQERLTQEDVATLITNTGVDDLDILFCHDAPQGIDLPGWPGWPADTLRDADINRSHLRAAVDATRPAVIMHGHWHMRYQTTLALGRRSSAVYGLADENEQGLAVLDLETLAVDDLQVPFPSLGALRRRLRR